MVLPPDPQLKPQVIKSEERKTFEADKPEPQAVNKQLKLTDAPTYDFMVVIGTQFSDDFMFGKSKWKMLKNFAMLDNYKEQAFYGKLSEPEKH